MVTQTNTCVICFDPIGINKWKCKKCNVLVHKKCVHQWKISNPHYPAFYTCPLCKHKYKIYNFMCILNFIKTYPYTLAGLMILFIGIVILTIYIIGITIMYIFLFG